MRMYEMQALATNKRKKKKKIFPSSSLSEIK